VPTGHRVGKRKPFAHPTANPPYGPQFVQGGAFGSAFWQL
jgi:hypothetical protein